MIDQNSDQTMCCKCTEEKNATKVSCNKLSSDVCILMT